MMGKIKDRKRVGGLGTDPAVEEYQQQAALNVAALSKKEQAERQRVRVYYDVPEWLKKAGEKAAKEEGTSASQLGAFLLAWAQRLYWHDDEELLRALEKSKQPSRSLRFAWNVEIPLEIEKLVIDGAI